MVVSKEIFDEKLQKPSVGSVIEVEDIKNILLSKIVNEISSALNKPAAVGKKVKVTITVVAKDEFGKITDLLV